MLDPSLDGPIVSRETLEKVKAYEDLVRQWSPRINLVSPADLDCLRHRHTLDSAQLVALSNTPQRWVDLGSGGGFPGIVVAIILQDRQKSARVTVVESDKRKCAFLTTVARSLDLDVDVLAQRAENLKLTDATTLSARAWIGCWPSPIPSFRRRVRRSFRKVATGKMSCSRRKTNGHSTATWYKVSPIATLRS